MRVHRLRLHDFRNYSSLDLSPGPGLNALIGNNAQGKSNVLEAIHLVAVTRSLRAGRESEMVRHGTEMAAVAIDVEREQTPDVSLEVRVFQTDKKAIRVNGVKRGRVLELLGELNSIHFSAQDLDIVSGDPAVRRHYLNVEISQISPRYVHDLVAYRRVLEQRNRLLRDLRERPYRDSGLEAWNEEMVRHGAPLVHRRRFFLQRLLPLADEVHRELTEGAAGLQTRYVPSIPLPEEDTQEAVDATFREAMERVATEELRRGVTLVGPQRDDVQFLIEGRDARVYGSQGERRTVVLALKLAEFRLVQEHVGETPVLLLDDVMSDLDERRQRLLLEWVKDRSQVFMTCTSLQGAPEAVREEAVRWRVDAGTVEREGAADGP